MIRLLITLSLLLLLGAPSAQASAPRGAAPPPGASAADAEQELVKQARELVKSGSSEAALELLRKHVKRHGIAPAVHEELGMQLFALQQLDLAAHHLEAARQQYLGAGDKRTAEKVVRTLVKADPLWRKKQSLFGKMVRELSLAAEKLEDTQQPERALDLYQRLRAIAEDKDLKQVEAAVARLKSSGTQVDLDSIGGSPGPDGKWPLVEHQTEYYELHCALEPEVIERLAETVDSMYLYFVDLYFDGRNKKGSKAKLYVHATWDDMAALWPGTPSPGLGGWWSPSQNEAHFYDTRDREGSLDGLLDTLFHELGHQFMTKLTRGSGVPSWFNEGTSCFFEGAIAMADGSVTWPEAAISRLGAIRGQLRDEVSGKQLVEEALGFTQGGSFGGQYYSIGWGLVYFMQQWENPETFEYSYRDLYRSYRDAIVGKTERSRELFDEIFLGKQSPLGHQDFDAFYADWRRWVLETVAPLFATSGDAERVRKLRSECIETYLSRAASAAQERKPLVSEQEFLLRALGHIEVVRTRLSNSTKPDWGLLLTQADVLERLDRGKNAAPLLEQYLDAVDSQLLSIDEQAYAEVEAHLAQLDKRNSALRNLRSRRKSSTVAAERLLDEYLEGEEALPLQAFTFAATATSVLADKGELGARSQELRARARDSGLLLGRIESLAAPAAEWTTHFAEAPELFVIRDTKIGMSSVRPNGKLLTSVPIEGEYELRAHLIRKGKMTLGSGHGLIACGSPDGEWLAIGVDRDGHLKLWKVSPSGTAAKVSRLRSITISKAVEESEPIDLAIHVFSDGRIEIRIEGREPVNVRLPFAMPRTCYAGVFVRDGEMIVEDPVVEIYP